jgi:hypothetical protein
MPVYDRTGRKLGTVESVYLGDVAETDDEYGHESASSPAPENHETSLIQEFARDIAPTEPVSEVLRERLFRHGFVRINSSGLFAADRYAMSEQIASVHDGRVILRVSLRELI